MGLRRVPNAKGLWRRAACLAPSPRPAVASFHWCCSALAPGGAWIGNLTALAPYQPIFVAITLGFLGYGYYLVFWKPKKACAEGTACARPLPNRVVKAALWTATLLVAAAMAFPYVAPILLDV